MYENVQCTSHCRNKNQSYEMATIKKVSMRMEGMWL